MKRLNNNRLVWPILWATLSSSSWAQDISFCEQFEIFDNQLNLKQRAFSTAPEQLAWQWFVCLNHVTDNGYRYWEGFRNTTDVFLDGGKTPLPFTVRIPDSEELVTERQALKLDSSAIFHNISTTIQADGKSLFDIEEQSVRYQMLMNRAAFDYIVQKQVYNLDGQVALAQQGIPLQFPPTAWELKLSWFWVGSNSSRLEQMVADGFIVVPSYFEENGEISVGFAALSGMHIVNKLLTNWTWSTFEHKRNNNYLTQAIDNTTGPTPAAIEQNQLFQQAYPDLGQYQLIGVQSDFEEQTLLANAQMESAFINQSSCLACHQRAAVNSNGEHLAYAIGWDEGLLFPTETMDAAEFPDYTLLDFVWSLRHAQWRVP